MVFDNLRYIRNFMMLLHRRHIYCQESYEKGNLWYKNDLGEMKGHAFATL